MLRILLTRRRRQLLVLTALCLFAVLTAGAASVTAELVTRPQRRDQAQADIHAWAEELASESRHGGEWAALLDTHAEWLLGACTFQPASAAQEP